MSRLEYDDSAFAYFALCFLVLFTLPTTYFFLKSLFKSPRSSADESGTYVSTFEQVSNKALLKFLKENPDFKPRTESERKRIEIIKEESSSSFISNATDSIGHLVQPKSALKIAFLAFLWFQVINLASICLKNDTQLVAFDPFEILGVPSDASDRQVRKKYRELSLKFHPDKFMKEDFDIQKKAEAQYIKISKAYAALTDEVSKENWIKYGNPDGKQPNEVSMGLPKFLLDKKNHNVVLLVYMMVLVIIIPAVVFLYYRRSRKFSDRFINKDTYQIFAFLLTVPNVMNSKTLIDLLALAAEYRSVIPMTPQNVDLFDGLRKVLLERKYITKTQQPKTEALFVKFPGCRMVFDLLIAHFSRMIPLNDFQAATEKTDFSAEELKVFRGYLNQVLAISPPLFDAMMELAQMKRSLILIKKICSFRAALVQAISPWNSNTFLMIPGWEQKPDETRLIGKYFIRKGIMHVGQLIDNNFFVEINEQEMRKNLEDKVEDFDGFVANMKHAIDQNHGLRKPKLDVQIGTMDFEIDETGEVIFESSTGVQDVVTIAITLRFGAEKAVKDMKSDAKEQLKAGSEDDVLRPHKKRNNLPKEDIKAIAFTPWYPGFLRESFSIAATPAGNPEFLLTFQEFVVDSNVMRKKLMFKPDFKKPGNYKFDFYLTSKTYLGFDEKVTLDLQVLSQDEVKAIEAHPEDEETEKTPGVFDIVYGQVAQDEDSDFADSDNEGGAGSEQKGAEVKK